MNWSALKSYGGQVPVSLYNRLVDAVQANSVSRGVGYVIKRTPGGTTLALKPGDGGGASLVCPFTVTTNVNAVDDSQLDVFCSPGSVNQLVPTNNFIRIDTISDSGLYYVIVTAGTDGAKVTSSSIDVSDVSPDDQTPVAFGLPTEVQILIAVINDGKVYRILGCGSIILTGSEEFKTDKSPPADPGELVYTPWYVWKVSLA